MGKQGKPYSGTFQITVTLPGNCREILCDLAEGRNITVNEIAREMVVRETEGSPVGEIPEAVQGELKELRRNLRLQEDELLGFRQLSKHHIALTERVHELERVLEHWSARKATVDLIPSIKRDLEEVEVKVKKLEGREAVG